MWTAGCCARRRCRPPAGEPVRAGRYRKPMSYAQFRLTYRLRRHLRWRWGVRPSAPDAAEHVSRVRQLIDAARRRDSDTATVLLAGIGHDLGEAGYYTT